MGLEPRGRSRRGPSLTPSDPTTEFVFASNSEVGGRNLSTKGHSQGSTKVMAKSLKLR